MPVAAALFIHDDMRPRDLLRLRLEAVDEEIADALPRRNLLGEHVHGLLDVPFEHLRMEQLIERYDILDILLLILKPKDIVEVREIRFAQAQAWALVQDFFHIDSFRTPMGAAARENRRNSAGSTISPRR